MQLFSIDHTCNVLEEIKVIASLYKTQTLTVLPGDTGRDKLSWYPPFQRTGNDALSECVSGISRGFRPVGQGGSERWSYKLECVFTVMVGDALRCCGYGFVT